MRKVDVKLKSRASLAPVEGWKLSFGKGASAWGLMQPAGHAGNWKQAATSQPDGVG
jgi:hypothetical protein